MSLKGFEPPTHGLEGRCSIQLSYRLIRDACRINVLYFIILYQEMQALFLYFFSFFILKFYPAFNQDFTYMSPHISRSALWIIQLILLYTRAVRRETITPFNKLNGATQKIANPHTLLTAGLIAAPASRILSRGMNRE